MISSLIWSPLCTLIDCGSSRWTPEAILWEVRRARTDHIRMLAPTRRYLLILLAVCPLAMATSAGAEHSTSWINPTVGDWFIADNWNNGVPGYDSIATIGWRDDLIGTVLIKERLA